MKGRGHHSCCVDYDLQKRKEKDKEQGNPTMQLIHDPTEA